jgi:hypothetical protein
LGPTPIGATRLAVRVLSGPPISRCNRCCRRHRYLRCRFRAAPLVVALLCLVPPLPGGIKLKVGYAQPTGETPFPTFRFSLSGKNIPKHGGEAHEYEGSYKGDFHVKPTTTTISDSSKTSDSKQGQEAGDACQVISMPFSSFSSDWSDFNGECGGTDPDGTVHRCCSSDAEEVCPSADRLKSVDGITIWAEGVEGVFALRVYEVNVTDAISETSSSC